MERKIKRPELAKSQVIKDMPAICSDELAAVEFLERTRWGETPCCPHCGDTDVFQLKDKATGERNKRFLWKCKGCKKQYTVRIGTVYEESRIPLRHWCLAFWLMSVSKKGISALQIMRQTGLSYKSALFLLHRIRFGMAKDHSKAPKLQGIVEADETYVGGKPRKQTGLEKRPYCSKKTPVFAALQRGGEVRTRIMPNVNGENIKQAMSDLVGSKTRLMTDSSNVYRGVAPMFDGGHETVDHSIDQYAYGDVTTNTVEGFFSIIKRGMYGIYHAVSKERLPLYMHEYEFRYNSRKMNDGERVLLAIRSADGKRLMYRQPDDQAAA